MERAEELMTRISSLGEAAIDEMIAERQSEELFLDFKRPPTTLRVRACPTPIVGISQRQSPALATPKGELSFGESTAGQISSSVMWPRPRSRSKTRGDSRAGLRARCRA